ncbi:MAG TPA: hypothetical protein VMU53_17160 [Candidatus Sulfotelmatobacter sp.]|nr:hypothetical protein [Candidatus Sulfotelmatobacter sp.]
MPSRQLLLPALLFALSVSASPTANLAPVSRANLCITEGSIEDPKMRAYLNASTPQQIAVHFTYLGSTGKEAPLGSGELRRQFGLKLRAQDACNLVYAMWRIEPQSKLVVSIKSNPGQRSSAECGNHGYRNIKPRRSRPAPALQSGATHDLRAQMNGDELTVLVDNSPVWQGSPGPESLSFDGPVGIRSDNAHLEFELLAPNVIQGPPPACRTGADAPE